MKKVGLSELRVELSWVHHSGGKFVVLALNDKPSHKQLKCSSFMILALEATIAKLLFNDWITNILTNQVAISSIDSFDYSLTHSFICLPVYK